MKHIPKIFVLATLWLTGCSMIGPIETTIAAPKPLVKPDRQAITGTPDSGSQTSTATESAQGTQIFQTPAPPRARRAPALRQPQGAPANEGDPTLSAVTLDGVPLPQFVNTIYATILKRNVSLDPAVQSRTDLVSLRTGKPQTAAQLSAAVQSVLRAYGVSVNEFDGLVRVVPSTGAGGVSPEIIRGRAQPDVPSSVRPIFYLVELDNTAQANVVSWVRTMFQGRVNVTEDPPRNAIMLSGQSDSVMAAVEAVRLLDQPILRGRYSARVTPVFWSATEMATRLVDVLTAQGYNTSQAPTATAPILILPIAPVNSVAVFATSEEALHHALRWARELDQTPPSRTGGGRYITYYVRNTDADAVAKTLQEVLGGGAAAAAPVAGAPAAPRPAGSSRVVVNAAANSIIIQSSPTEYQQLYGLLQELDRPARSALIMATVAEVTLSEDEQFGFNWLLRQFTSHGYNVNGRVGPTPGAGPQDSGLTLNFASMAGDPRALLTALATSSRVRVLSNPSIVAINGQTASIQVGKDVPILTSQIGNTNSTSSNSTSVMQTVQYRNVGIILKVKPVIHSGGRVDLEISQEVSGSTSQETGVGNSPVITTRKVDTRLSVVDGNTMLIGGLITEQRDGSNAGVPYLKDVPLAGALFRTKGGETMTRTELVLLITPHIIEDDFDSRAMTEAFRSQFSWGKEIPLSVKEQAKVTSVAPLAATPAVSPGGAGKAESEGPKPYVLPRAPVEAPMAPTQPRAQDLPASLPLTSGTPGASVAPGATPAVIAPAKGGASTPKTTVPAPGKQVTDEKLRQELLDAIRSAK